MSLRIVGVIVFDIVVIFEFIDLLVVSIVSGICQLLVSCVSGFVANPVIVDIGVVSFGTGCGVIDIF